MSLQKEDPGCVLCNLQDGLVIPGADSPDKIS